MEYTRIPKFSPVENTQTVCCGPPETRFTALCGTANSLYAAIPQGPSIATPLKFPGGLGQISFLKSLKMKPLYHDVNALNLAVAPTTYDNPGHPIAMVHYLQNPVPNRVPPSGDLCGLANLARKTDDMPSKKSVAQILPYASPFYIPDHPYNHIPSFEMEEDPYYATPRRRTEREQRKLQRQWLEKAMSDWTPPHAIRSWETNDEIAERRRWILSLQLSPRPRLDYEPLNRANPNDSSISKRIAQELYRPEKDKDRTDFRRFANRALHLGYHRFHASHGEPNLPSEETDPAISEEDICWVMEYSINECAIVRRKIAEMMGLYPETVDPNNFNYDEDTAEDYRHKLYVRCRRRNKKCIRPSHIILFGSDFKDIP